MFQIQAQVINVFTVPETDKHPQGFKVQLLGDQVTKDGQVRKEMVTIGTPVEIFRYLEGKLGQVVRLPIGIFINEGRIQPFFPKGNALSALLTEPPLEEA